MRIKCWDFRYDFVTIYDGASTSYPILGPYCGDTIPPDHISSRRSLLVHFHSDSSVTRSGFQLEHHKLNTKGKKIGKVWSLQLYKQKFAATIHFLEGLENELRNKDSWIHLKFSEFKIISIFADTGGPLIVRFLGPRKHCTNENLYY